MFKTFEANFVRDPDEQDGKSRKGLVPDLPGLSRFFEVYGGASFEHGLYRVIRPSELPLWQQRIALAFPEYTERVVCFAYDWAGDVFALDIECLEDGQAGVTLFEPGMGEVLRIPSNLQTFHERGLMEFGEAALAVSFYNEWRLAGGKPPAYDRCVGYRVPLFLGGEDVVENLEDSDLDVYWHLAGQLIAKAKGLPPGSRIRVGVE